MVRRVFQMITMMMMLRLMMGGGGGEIHAQANSCDQVPTTSIV